MQYMGGKSRIAKPIAAAILEATSARCSYVEPFMGAGSVAAQLVPQFKRAYLSDASEDLIALWSAVQRGWEPPVEVTSAEYASLREAAPSALRGFAGYGCSFGGKWFGGYARNARADNFALQSRNSLLRKADILAPAMIYQSRYDDAMIPLGSVVYLDPPYAGTTGYDRIGAFDNPGFWTWAEKLSKHSRVFVSEYSAPGGWAPVWEGNPQASLGLKDQTERAHEKLWSR